MNRRDLMKAGLGAVAVAALPASVLAAPEPIRHTYWRYQFQRYTDGSWGQVRVKVTDTEKIEPYAEIMATASRENDVEHPMSVRVTLPDKPDIYFRSEDGSAEQFKATRYAFIKIYEFYAEQSPSEERLYVSAEFKLLGHKVIDKIRYESWDTTKGIKIVSRSTWREGKAVGYVTRDLTDMLT